MKSLAVITNHACDWCGRPAATIEPTTLSYAVVCTNPSCLPGAIGISATSTRAMKPELESPMPTRDELFPSRFLKASDLAGKPIVVTINSAETEELKDMNGKPATKLVLGFKKMRKKLVINRTNFDSVSEFYGDDTNNWLNKSVELYPDRVGLGGKMVACIRVRQPIAAEMNDEIGF